jgi:hypothetical protein
MSKHGEEAISLKLFGPTPTESGHGRDHGLCTECFLRRADGANVVLTAYGAYRQHAGRARTVSR